MTARPAYLRRDLLTASVLALVLGVVWTLRDWAALSALRLPDTDDGMRLQQVRDWLGGQAFGDLTQYRLGMGVPMHWSRLADLIPAGSIATLTPLIGRHGAELATVVAWPILLFAAALTLVARIARAAGGEAGTACIVAAIAYPATTIFLPGRIDHHGLQIVLLLGATLALIRPPCFARGAIAGSLAAASLTIGMETMPLFAVLGVAGVATWIRDGRRAGLAGLGIGALVGLTIAAAVFAPRGWDYPACDGFTAQAWRAATIAATAPVLLALISPWLATWRLRAAAAAIACALSGALALYAAPGCASPYGAVDPVLARLWLSQVGEAQSVSAAPIATVIGYCGVMIAGLAATLLRLRIAPDRAWIMLAALQIGALAIAAVQLRGAYAGAMLAAPALAATIAAARRRGPAALALAWLVSAGMLYPIVAQAVAPHATPDRGDTACDPAGVTAALATLPPGLVMAPIDVGGYGIPATRHRFVAAPYHRNDAGNRAMYRFYLGDVARAQAVARRWGVRYVLTCGGFGAIVPPRGSMADRLARGTPPPWLTSTSPPTSDTTILIVRP